LSVEVGALFAERLASVSLLPIFGLDVVARVALSVVVVNTCLDRMPRRRLGHTHSFVYVAR
jgi:hypothetical protein